MPALSLQIAEVIEKTMNTVPFDANPSYETYIQTDLEARRKANGNCFLCKKHCLGTTFVVEIHVVFLAINVCHADNRHAGANATSINN